MTLASIIQEFGPEKTRAAWTVISLGAAMAMLVATPLFVMFLFRRARLRETHSSGEQADPLIDPWVESGNRMTDRMDPAGDDDDHQQDDEQSDGQPEDGDVY